MDGISINEIILVALLLVLVLLAPKVSRIGETLGARLAGPKAGGRAERSGRGSPATPRRRGDAPPAG